MAMKKHIYSPTAIKAFQKLIASGMSVEDACVIARMSKVYVGNTVAEARSECSEVCLEKAVNSVDLGTGHRLLHAIELGNAEFIQKHLDIINKSNNPSVSLQLLGRKHPDKWGKKLEEHDPNVPTEIIVKREYV